MVKMYNQNKQTAFVIQHYIILACRHTLLQLIISHAVWMCM